MLPQHLSDTLIEIKERQNNHLTKWNILQAQNDIKTLIHHFENIESSEIKKDFDQHTQELTGSNVLNKLPERFRWTIHNVIAHPLSEVLFQVGMEKASDWVHDVSIPQHKPGTDRG